MPRAKAPCGEYAAYRRHQRMHEPIDEACRRAQREHDTARSTSAKARVARSVSKPPKDTPLTEDGHVSRLEVLKELLEEQRLLLPKLRDDDPSRAYLLMREQRETLREIAELQGNGQVKGVTLGDQLAEARAARLAAAAAS